MSGLSDSPKATNARKILFLALGFFFAFGFPNVSYFLPVYYKQIGIASADAAGWLVSAFYITSVLSRPFLGNVVSRLGFKRTFYAAGALGVSGSVGVALAGAHFVPALIARGVLGVASSLFQIGLATYQAIAFRPEERGRAFSLIMAGGLAPMMTLVPLADLLLQHRWNVAYIVFPGLVCLGAAIVAPMIPGLADAVPERRPREASRGAALGGFAACLRIRPLRLSFLAMFLFSVTDAAAAFMGTMTSHFGLMSSLFLSSNAVIGVILRVFCAKLLDRWPRGAFSAVTTTITASALLLASLAPSGRSLVLLGMLYGVGMGFGFPVHLALVSDCAPRELQPQAVALSWFLMGCAFTLVPPLSGWFAEIAGPVNAHRLVVAPTLLITAAMYFLWRRAERSDR